MKPRFQFVRTGPETIRWRLRTEDVVVATATHAYGRRIEAQRGLDRFRIAAADATTQGVETISDWRTKYRTNSRH